MSSRLDIWIQTHSKSYKQDQGCHEAIITANAAHEYQQVSQLIEPFCKGRHCENCILNADTTFPNNMNKVLRTLVIE